MMYEGRWAGETGAVIASGPSVRVTQYEKLYGRARVCAVNDSHRLVPWADMLYAADWKWWRHHNFVHHFRGERWTQHIGCNGWPLEAAISGINVIRCVHKLNVSYDPSYVGSGWNSAFQAMNLLIHMGITKILLIGVDLHDIKGTHWFGDHPPGLQRRSPYATFRKAFEQAAAGMAERGIEVINCSNSSALKVFPVMHVEDALR